MMTRKKYPQNWVRHYRKQKGMSAEALGSAIGMSKEGVTFIERLERGLSIEVAKKMADALEVHYTAIIDGPDAGVSPQNEAQKRMLEAMQSSEWSEEKQDTFVSTLLATLSTRTPEKKTSNKK